jgi:hypothetical protein
MTPIAPVTLSEQLLYSTVRLACGNSVGTGFFFHATLHGRHMPLLVTNRHVISPSDLGAITSNGTTFNVELAIHGHRLVVQDGKPAPSGESYVIRTATHTWFGHPDPAVDLAVMRLRTSTRSYFTSVLSPHISGQSSGYVNSPFWRT